MGSRDSPGDSPGTPRTALAALAAPDTPPSPSPVVVPYHLTAAVVAGSRPRGKPRSLSVGSSIHTHPCASVPCPGIAFRQRVLASFLSSVSHDLLAFPDLGPARVMWVVAPFPSKCFSVSGVTRLLSYFFCSPDERLTVSYDRALVFAVKVACPAIAEFLAAVGPGLMSAINLALFVSWMGPTRPRPMLGPMPHASMPVATNRE